MHDLKIHLQKWTKDGTTIPQRQKSSVQGYKVRVYTHQKCRCTWFQALMYIAQSQVYLSVHYFKHWRTWFQALMYILQALGYIAEHLGVHCFKLWCTLHKAKTWNRSDPYFFNSTSIWIPSYSITGYTCLNLYIFQLSSNLTIKKFMS